MRQVIGLTPNIGENGVLDEDIKVMENMIIPLVMNVDQSMITVDKVEE